MLSLLGFVNFAAPRTKRFPGRNLDTTRWSGENQTRKHSARTKVRIEQVRWCRASAERSSPHMFVLSHFSYSNVVTIRFRKFRRASNQAVPGAEPRHDQVVRQKPDPQAFGENQSTHKAGQVVPCFGGAVSSEYVRVESFQLFKCCHY